LARGGIFDPSEKRLAVGVNEFGDARVIRVADACAAFGAVLELEVFAGGTK